MDVVSIVSLVLGILSMIFHGIHLKNSKCHLGKAGSCCGCDLDIASNKESKTNI
jgi:hypothetical protein